MNESKSHDYLSFHHYFLPRTRQSSLFPPQPSSGRIFVIQ
jgi:hypothetical protein